MNNRSKKRTRSGSQTSNVPGQARFGNFTDRNAQVTPGSSAMGMKNGNGQMTGSGLFQGQPELQKNATAGFQNMLQCQSLKPTLQGQAKSQLHKTQTRQSQPKGLINLNTSSQGGATSLLASKSKSGSLLHGGPSYLTAGHQAGASGSGLATRVARGGQQSANIMNQNRSGTNQNLFKKGTGVVLSRHESSSRQGCVSKISLEVGGHSQSINTKGALHSSSNPQLLATDLKKKQFLQVEDHLQNSGDVDTARKEDYSCRSGEVQVFEGLKASNPEFGKNLPPSAPEAKPLEEKKQEILTSSNEQLNQNSSRLPEDPILFRDQNDQQMDHREAIQQQIEQSASLQQQHFDIVQHAARQLTQANEPNQQQISYTHTSNQQWPANVRLYHQSSGLQSPHSDQEKGINSNPLNSNRPPQSIESQMDPAKYAIQSATELQDETIEKSNKNVQALGTSSRVQRDRLLSSDQQIYFERPPPQGTFTEEEDTNQSNGLPPGMRIVNFLGHQFIEPEEPPPGEGAYSARERFQENMQQVDFQGLNARGEQRKGKLEHIQQLLFDNVKQEEKQLSEQISRPPVYNERQIFKGQDGVSVLKMPNEMIYNEEKMPFVFQNPKMGDKLTEMRHQIDFNLYEAAFLAKHKSDTGVLGIAQKRAVKQVRPQTCKAFSRIKGLKPRRKNLLQEQKELAKLDPDTKKRSVQALESKAGFQFKSKSAYSSNYDKAVSHFLKEWVDGKTVLTQDWHTQIENGRITNVQNHGLLIGRKKCNECSRYRCNHVQFSGGIVEQNKLTLKNMEVVGNDNSQVPPSEPPLTREPGAFYVIPRAKNLDDKAKIAFKQLTHLPPGQGVTNVKPTPIYTKINETKHGRRLKSATSAGARNSTKTLGFSEAGSSRAFGKIFSSNHITLGADPKLSTDYIGDNPYQPQTTLAQSWTSPFLRFKKDEKMSYYQKKVSRIHEQAKQLLKQEEIDSASTESHRQILLQLKKSSMASTQMLKDTLKRNSDQQQAFLNTKSGQIEVFDKDKAQQLIANNGMFKVSKTTLRSSRESGLYVPVEDALAMISQFDQQLKHISSSQHCSSEPHGVVGDKRDQGNVAQTESGGAGDNNLDLPSSHEKDQTQKISFGSTALARQLLEANLLNSSKQRPLNIDDIFFGMNEQELSQLAQQENWGSHEHFFSPIESGMLQGKSIAEGQKNLQLSGTNIIRTQIFKTYQQAQNQPPQSKPTPPLQKLLQSQAGARREVGFNTQVVAGGGMNNSRGGRSSQQSNNPVVPDFEPRILQKSSKEKIQKLLRSEEREGLTSSGANQDFLQNNYGNINARNTGIISEQTQIGDKVLNFNLDPKSSRRHVVSQEFIDIDQEKAKWGEGKSFMKTSQVTETLNKSPADHFAHSHFTNQQQNFAKEVMGHQAVTNLKVEINQGQTSYAPEMNLITPENRGVTQTSQNLRQAIVTSDTVVKSMKEELVSKSHDEETGEVVALVLDSQQRQNLKDSKEGQVSVIIYNKNDIASRLSVAALTDQETMANGAQHEVHSGRMMDSRIQLSENKRNPLKNSNNDSLKLTDHNVTQTGQLTEVNQIYSEEIHIHNRGQKLNQSSRPGTGMNRPVNTNAVMPFENAKELSAHGPDYSRRGVPKPAMKGTIQRYYSNKGGEVQIQVMEGSSISTNSQPYFTVASQTRFPKRAPHNRTAKQLVNKEQQAMLNSGEISKGKGSVGFVNRDLGEMSGQKSSSHLYSIVNLQAPVNTNLVNKHMKRRILEHSMRKNGLIK